MGGYFMRFRQRTRWRTDGHQLAISCSLRNAFKTEFQNMWSHASRSRTFLWTLCRQSRDRKRRTELWMRRAGQKMHHLLRCSRSLKGEYVKLHLLGQVFNKTSLMKSPEAFYHPVWFGNLSERDAADLKVMIRWWKSHFHDFISSFDAEDRSKG